MFKLILLSVLLTITTTVTAESSDVKKMSEEDIQNNFFKAVTYNNFKDMHKYLNAGASADIRLPDGQLVLVKLNSYLFYDLDRDQAASYIIDNGAKIDYVLQFHSQLFFQQLVLLL